MKCTSEHVWRWAGQWGTYGDQQLGERAQAVLGGLLVLRGLLEVGLDLEHELVGWL